jgi:hypothetical protein
VGNDVLVGGGSADTFVFAKGYGHDTITDFKVLTDKLAISGFEERPQLTVTNIGFELDFSNGDLLSINIEESEQQRSVFRPATYHWVDNLPDIFS